MGAKIIGFFLGFFSISIPEAFEYCSTKMTLSLITSLLVCLYVGPAFIRTLYRLKIGQSIRKEECPKLGLLHAKKEDTPTMGGVLIIFSLLISAILWMDFQFAQSWLLIGTLLFFGIVGAFDDYKKLKLKNAKGISSRTKFLFQVLWAGGLVVYLLSPCVQGVFESHLKIKPPVAKQWIVVKNTPDNPLTDVTGRVLQKNEAFMQDLYLPFLKMPVYHFAGWSLIFLFALFIIVISGSSNAVNLTDGLDGLATGTMVVTCVPLAVIAFISNHIEVASYLNILYIEGSGEVAIFLASLIGACLGFLWYNAPPAQVFMGDTGSLSLGGCLGLCAILIKREFLLALVGGIFVAEALSVILQVLNFRLRGKRIFLCAPLHHHYEYKGIAETKVVIRFWIVSIFCAMLGLFSIKFQ